MKLYLNLPVSDLPRTRAFFTALGFTFDDRFSDDTGVAMNIGEGAYAMLLTREKFAGFARRPLGDAKTHTSALFALQVDSREAVDRMVKAAVANGGSPALDPNDHGFMYQWSFFDPDGHHWEVFHMDLSQMPQG